MENDEVFREYHQFLYEMFTEGLIHGLRIDHIDGLKDPSRYIHNLRRLFGDSCYIIAEKILEAKETIPPSWPLQGTSGYEFLAFANRLLTNRKGARKLVEFYRTLVPELPGYKKLVEENKRMMLENYMGGEWDNLVNHFFELQLQEDTAETNRVKDALGLFMISLPVYRIYPDKLPLEGNDLKVVENAFTKAKQLATSCQPELDYLYNLFVVPPGDKASNALAFLQRLMQFTGPLTAKGVEDTTFYIYNPLISHDEVGDSPAKLGISVDEFHTRMLERQQIAPLSLNATATHDTKRGEDVRVRLNVLSEITDEWEAIVTQWLEMNSRFRRDINGKTAPSVNDEYFIYQSVIGGFPEDLIVTDVWIKRVQEYMVKVVREAKVNSNWESPDEGYENACTDFIAEIANDHEQFIPTAIDLLQKIVSRANTHALSQVLIKITAPGIPDTYQGCELWDLSYVDPDNRRPVDFGMRRNHLDQIIEYEQTGYHKLLSFVASKRDTGLEKLYVTWKSLNFRKNHSQLFSEGVYIPLQVMGNDGSAVAYARRLKNRWILIAMPLSLAAEMAQENDNHNNKDSYIELPGDAPSFWQNIFTGGVEEGRQIPLKSLWRDFPVAFLEGKEK
jgi:(1->4)-alpha-D-glucan 1-alpha-D-glucosylmutase